MEGLGLIHLYTGCGKGKTTAAVGLAVRLLGRGGRVVFIQFLKGENSGERFILRELPGVELIRLPEKVKFTARMNDAERAECAEVCREQFEMACALAADRDLLVLDEALGAIETGMLPLSAVLGFLKNKPEQLEVVLTGRRAPKELKEAADYVMRVDSEKHPYTSGISARRGIEF